MPIPTTSYGYELEIADDAGHNDTPVCCNRDMTGSKTAEGGVDFRCSRCRTVLEIDNSGLVADIYKGTLAA